MQVQKISETIQKFDGLSYYRCGPYFQRKGKRLHRVVWEANNGPIPEGYEIHHIDGNRANNEVENLQLLLSEEHGRLHMSNPERKAASRKNISKAAYAAREWHSTKDGKAWHAEHAKRYWEHAKQRTYTCIFCGKEFQTKNVYGPEQNTFCCNNHKAAWRRQQGLDNEERVCPVCGDTFIVNRYAKNVCCSQKCARKRRWSK